MSRPQTPVHNIVPRSRKLVVPSSSIESCPTDSDVSIFCWNVLADTFLMKNVREYAHIPHEWKVWDRRCPAILDEIESADADIVCLQEVEFKAFDQDFKPKLAALGYSAAMQNDNKRSQKHSSGVATFWKRDKFELVVNSSRSRAMTVVLKDQVHRVLAVCNVHLEGHPMLSTARVKQLQNSLRELAMKHSHNALVVVGDFNCQMRSSACGAYLSFGSCPPGLLEWGHPVPESVQNIPAHHYELAAAALPARLQQEAVEQEGLFGSFHDFTYCQHIGRPVSGLDQCWFSKNTLDHVATRALFFNDEQRLSILKTGLPSPANTSDHIPIGAVLRWKSSTGQNLPDLKVSQPQRHNNASQAVAPEKLGEEADLLLQACPITDEQRMEFEATMVPVQVGKRRPTEEELKLIVALRERKQQLLSSVSPEARQMLQRVIKLRKKARQTKPPR